MTNQCAIFEAQPDQASILAAHMPLGGVFDAAREQDTNFNNLLKGLGEELFRLEGEIFNVCREMDPQITVALLPEWERSVSIPDDCFSSIGDLVTRRAQVLLKLRGFRVQTVNDFIDLAAILGKTIEIEPGAIRGAYPMAYPGLYLGGAKAARFSMIVHFPNDVNTNYPQLYPVPYGVTTGVVVCVIEHTVPANVRAIFSYGTSAP